MLDKNLASVPRSLFLVVTFSVSIANLFKSELVNIGSLTIISQNGLTYSGVATPVTSLDILDLSIFSNTDVSNFILPSLLNVPIDLETS